MLYYSHHYGKGDMEMAVRENELVFEFNEKSKVPFTGKFSITINGIC